MSEELTLQDGNSQENAPITRTITVSIENNGLGITQGQVFPSVTVDFAPIIAPASVHWGDIIGKPDPVTRVFYNQSESDFEYETFEGQGEVIISRDTLKEILNVPINAAKVYSYDDNFDDLKTGDVVISFDGNAWIVREKEDYHLELCSYNYRAIASASFIKNQGVWEVEFETETPIKLEDVAEGNFVSIDENGNISDSGSKASDFLTQHQDISGKADKVTSATEGNFAGLDANGNLTDSEKSAADFVAYIGYNPRESDFVYRKYDINGQDEIIISRDDLKALIVPEISTNIVTDASSDDKTASPKAVKTYVDNKVSTAYNAAGSAASVAALGSLDASHEGFVYNMSASFTTTSDFVEGSGITYPSGTNVVIVNVGTAQSASYKYDVLAGFVDISGKMDKLEPIITGSHNFIQQFGNGGDVAVSNYNESSFATAAQGAKADTAYQKPSSGIPASDLASGVIPSVPVQDVTVGGTSVVSSGTAVIPAIPDITNCIQTSQTAGLVKNDGTIDTTSYMASNASVVKYVSQSLTAAQKQQARTNIGAGNGYYGDLLSKPSLNQVELTNYTDSAIYELPIVTYREEVDFTQLTVESGSIKIGWSGTGEHYLIPIKDDIVGVLFVGNQGLSNYAFLSESQLPNGTDTPPDPFEVISFPNKSVPHENEKYIYVAKQLIDGTYCLPDHMYLLRLRDRDKADKTVVCSSQPAGGMLPNTLYKLGTLSGSVTISFASPADNTIENEYRFTFTAGSTAPTITWPNSVTAWAGNSLDNGAPKVEASTYYEVSVEDGYGIFNKF